MSNEKEEEVSEVLKDVISQEDFFQHTLSIIILGGSGDLAKKKTFPALGELFVRDLLPSDVMFIGYSRSSFSHDEFRNRLRPFIEKRFGYFLRRC